MTTPISPLPTPPSPADSPVDFNTKAFALLGALPAFVTEANAQASGLDAAVASAGVEADAAALKAGEALASANNAAISKTGADSARDDAVIAKNAAEAALDSFDDRYLGAKAVAPTTDNDGGALLPGALYWDTVLGAMRAWSGSVWVTLPATTAASISNTPAGSISATSVQAAINELGSEKVALSGGVMTGDLTVPSINGGQLSGMRNKIINGNFGVNQRNVSGTVTLAAGAYGHDRWKAGTSGCTYTYATTQNVTTITITSGSLVQVIEGRNLQSGTHVLSWQGTAQGRVDGGAYGASGGVTGTAIGGTNQTVEFNAGTVRLVQYEPGPVATPFEHRPYSVEETLGHRYYWKTNQTLYPVSIGLSGYASLLLPLPVTMRATPTVTASFTDDQYTGTAPVAGSQWTFINPGAAYSTKTGTVLVVPYVANQSCIGIAFQSAQFTSGAQLVSTPSNIVAANAEL